MFHFGPGPKQKDYNTDTDLIRSEIGIIVDGNKSALGASTGQYVILKNSTISGKTDGLYKAAQAIPANTAIDGSYLTAVSGGLGAEVASANSSISTLNGNLEQLTTEKMDAWNETTSLSTPLSGESYGNGSYYYKFGRFVFIAISIKFTSPPTNIKVFTLPSSIIPSLESRSLQMSGGSSYLSQARAVITPQGNVFVTSEDNYVMGSAMYML